MYLYLDRRVRSGCPSSWAQNIEAGDIGRTFWKLWVSFHSHAPVERQLCTRHCELHCRRACSWEGLPCCFCGKGEAQHIFCDAYVITKRLGWLCMLALSQSLALLIVDIHCHIHPQFWDYP